jgi:O-antigen/teichoic acid export membrane protein
VGWSLGGSGAQTLIGILTTTLLARALGPSGFGILSVVLALVFIVAGLSDLGWSAAFIRLGSPEVMRGGDLRPLNETFLGLRLALAVVVGVALLVAGRWILPSLQLPSSLGWLAWAAAAAGIALAVGTHHVTALQVARNQRAVTVIRTTASALRLAGYAALAFGRRGGLSLDGALVVGLVAIPLEAVFTVRAAFRSVRLWPPVWRRPPAAWLVLSAWTAVPALAFTLIGQTDTLLLASLAGTVQTGLWNAAARVAGVATMVSGAIWAVAFPYATGTLAAAQIERYLRLGWLAVLGLAGACALGIAVAPWVTLLLYGRAYDGAVPALRWLLAANALGAAAMLLIPVAYRLGHERLVAVVAIVEFGVNLGGDVALIPAWGASGCAAATFAMRVLSLGILLPAVGLSAAKRRREMERLPLLPAAAGAGAPPDIAGL